MLEMNPVSSPSRVAEASRRLPTNTATDEHRELNPVLLVSFL